MRAEDHSLTIRDRAASRPLAGGDARGPGEECITAGLTVSLPIAVRPVVSGSYMSSTTSAG